MLADGRAHHLIDHPKFDTLMKEEVCELFRKRWDAFSSPYRCAGFALDREFRDVKLNREKMKGLRTVCTLMLGNDNAAK